MTTSCSRHKGMRYLHNFLQREVTCYLKDDGIL